MPSIIHVTSTLHCKSGILTDDVTNGFTFTGPGDPASCMTAAIASVSSFWQDASHLCDLMGASVSRTKKITLKSYVLSSTSGAAPDVRVPPGFGHPVDQRDIFFHTAGELTGQSLPQQIALCLSYHTDYGTSVEHSGAGPRPAERKRGRLFIGPWTDNSGTNAVDPATNVSVPHASVIHALGLAGQILLTTGPAAIFGVWSRKDNLVRPVVGMSIDNRWDTQRRRDQTATFKEAFDGATVLP